jgi:phosphate transport system substrate-binding protein
MGFASFVAGDIGQRIILKSGLLPIRTPAEKLVLLQIIKKKKENE